MVDAIGAIDGINRVYTVPSVYAEGRTRVRYNGVWLTSDSITELPGNLQIELDFAPSPSDEFAEDGVRIFYVPAV